MFGRWTRMCEKVGKLEKRVMQLECSHEEAEFVYDKYTFSTGSKLERNYEKRCVKCKKTLQWYGEDKCTANEDERQYNLEKSKDLLLKNGYYVQKNREKE